MNSKLRLDELLLSKGMSESRSKASQLIKAGRVMVEGSVVEKPGFRVDVESRIAITGGKQLWVVDTTSWKSPGVF
jgi:23S rRNA (cytidine1920-2'-O)/16S rRNA (cytidine1409-2'-O)-methyltransferase